MNTLAFGMAASSFVVVMGTFVAYLAKIPRSQVPVWPLGSIILQCIGLVLAVSAIVWSLQSSGSGSSGAAVFIPATLALMLSLAFLWLLSQRKTPIGDLKVQLGGTLLPFTATLSDGGTFHTDELAGKRTLLKFFRGGW